MLYLLVCAYWRWTPYCFAKRNNNRARATTAQNSPSQLCASFGFRVLLPLPKNSENNVLWIFLSKPQAWHIITRQRVYHRRRRISSREACISADWWYTMLRIDDIPQQVADDIHGFAVIFCKTLCSAQYNKTDMEPFFTKNNHLIKNFRASRGNCPSTSN